MEPFTAPLPIQLGRLLIGMPMNPHPSMAYILPAAAYIPEAGFPFACFRPKLRPVKFLPHHENDPVSV
jgi:hypothetical protein